MITLPLLLLQVVKNLQVIVDIEESSNITTLEVPDIKTANEIETTVSSKYNPFDTFVFFFNRMGS